MQPGGVLDEVMPRWDWRTCSTAWVDAGPDAVFLAFEQVSMSELPGQSEVRMHQAGRDPSGTTLLADLLGQGFSLLGERPDRELVLGRIGPLWRPAAEPVADDGREAFVAFERPGHAKAALALRALPVTDVAGSGTMVSVELRVIATDPSTRRDFSRHWLVGAWANTAGRLQLLAAVRRRVTDPRRPL